MNDAQKALESIIETMDKMNETISRLIEAITKARAIVAYVSDKRDN